MKNFVQTIIFILLLAAIEGHAKEQAWKLLFANDAGSYFYDPNVSVKSDSSKTLVVKLNASKVGVDGSKSRLLKYRIDCSEKSFILESVNLYTDVDLGGMETIGKINPNIQKSIPKQGTAGEFFVNAACNISSGSEGVNTNTAVSSEIPENSIIHPFNQRSWKFLNSFPGGGGGDAYLDMSSIKLNGDWRQVSLINKYKSEQDEGGRKYLYHISPVAFKCRASSIPVIIHTGYDFISKDGRVIEGSRKFSSNNVDGIDYWGGIVKSVCGFDGKMATFALPKEYSVLLDNEIIKKKKMQDEEDARPRGYYLTCNSNEFDGNFNLIVVNCQDPNEVTRNLAKAWALLDSKRSEYAKDCLNVFAQAKNLASSTNTVNVLRQAASGYFASCNLGLGYIEGPSKKSAAKK